MPRGNDQIWCPISKFPGPRSSRAVTHLVPWKISHQTIGDLFDGDGRELLWSLENGLIISRDFADAFDNLDFCLLPVPKAAGEVEGWKVCLINEELRRDNIVGHMTWDNWDGQELRFRNDERPGRKFLYFHYVMCVFKALRTRTSGWEALRAKVRDGKMWPVQEAYLRTSMLEELAKLAGIDFPRELIDSFGNEAQILDPARERIGANDLFAAFIPSSEFPLLDDEDDS